MLWDGLLIRPTGTLVTREAADSEPGSIRGCRSCGFFPLRHFNLQIFRFPTLPVTDLW